MDAALPLLEIVDVSKRFPGVVALSGVSISLERGQVHALLGENGAGKSTLVNLLCGVYRPDDGQIKLSGMPITLRDPVEARKQGIVVVHQEPDVFETLDVAESLALSNGLPSRFGIVRWSEVNRAADHVINGACEIVRSRDPARMLSIAQRQKLAISLAIEQNPGVVLLDEPTSSLSRAESEWLFDRIAELKSRGAGILYISHRFEEIERVCDCVTVLRDGKVVATGPVGEFSRDRMIQLMVGRSQTENRPPAPSTADHPRRTLLQVEGVTDRSDRFRQISLEIREGEILGLYGLIGAGRSEFARALFGMGDLAEGKIELDGCPYSPDHPRHAVEKGIAYLPEDRLKQAIFSQLAVRSNLVIASLRRWSIGPFVSRSRERRATQASIASMGVKAQSPEQAISQLSGGNQQKIVFARWILTNPKVLILDEPTRGVDLNAKAEIHRLIREVTDQGTGVMLVSSDLPEILSVSDRIAVFRKGSIAATWDRSDATPERVAEASLPTGPTSAANETHPRTGLRPRKLGLLLSTALMVTLLALTTGGRFLTAANLVGILMNASVIVILALGQSAVMIAGGIDISVGSLMALAAASGAIAMRSALFSGFPVLAGIAVGLLVGFGGGVLNAAIVIGGRLQPIVVTLGMMTVYRGTLILLTGGQVLGDLPDTFRNLANGRVGVVPGSVILLGLIVVAAWFFLSSTVWGRQIYAHGSNSRASRVAGISSARVWIVAFGMGGLLVGLAGLLELAQNGSMQTVMGQGYELKAIAAAVIGGVAVTGGRGGVTGVFLGALFLSLLQNSLVLWEISRYHYDLVIGGILMLAVLSDRFRGAATR